MEYWGIVHERFLHMRESDKITYSINHMYDVASQMMANATNALDNHDKAWNKINSYIQVFPWFMQSALHAVVDPYDHRARSSYDWQIATALAIKSAADAMAGADDEIKRSFNG